MYPNLKQLIIDEAYSLFILKGIKQTSFCDVALAVHKSKGAVIHYFPSKKQLIEAVIKTRFFPASELGPEMELWAEKKWNDFIQLYKNPIERGMGSFPEKRNTNKLMNYMQFISSANECMAEFPQMYRELLARELGFLLEMTRKAVTNHEITVKDIPAFSRQAFDTSIGRTFSNLLLKI